MTNPVAGHYGRGGDIAKAVAEGLVRAGKDMSALSPADLAGIDEFHIRGRAATLELAAPMGLGPGDRVLDIGSGLGGPARALAAEYGCHVTGIDLTREFCDAATTLSAWVGLAALTDFRQGDATALPFADAAFDAAVTIHVAMNIAAKDRLYAEARRVLKPGGIFAVYDVLKGEGGDVFYPVPWAREPSISHLVTPDGIASLLGAAGFRMVETRDSSEASLAWLEANAARRARTGAAPLTARTFLGDDFPAMAANIRRNLAEDRIRTVSFICRA